MTVANNYDPIKQMGNGITKSFSYSFDVASINDIVVYQNINGVQSVIPSSEYEVEVEEIEDEDNPPLNPTPTGNVIFNEAPAAGTIIVIDRATPQTQETPYKTSSGFPAVRVEQNFDKLTLMVQELQDASNRSVKVSETSSINPDELAEEVERLYDSIDNIDTLANISEDVSTLSNVADSIPTVAEVASDIPVLSNISEDIETLADIATDVSTVSSISEDVTTVAHNLETIRFGMYKREFLSTDWVLSDGKYSMTLGYNMVTGVYKSNSGTYELITNIDVATDGSSVTLYSKEAFDGFALLVNSAVPTTYVHEQAVAASTWIINHGLGRYPSVTVVDSAENEIIASVKYLDENTCKVDVSSPFKGKAYLN